MYQPTVKPQLNLKALDWPTLYREYTVVEVTEAVIDTLNKNNVTDVDLGDMRDNWNSLVAEYKLVQQQVPADAMPYYDFVITVIKAVIKAVYHKLENNLDELVVVNIIQEAR